MNCIDILMEMFYPRFQPPKSMGTIKHKIGFSGQPRYTAPSRPPKEERDPDRLTPSEDKAFNILWRKDKPMTSRELAPFMKMTDNHCGILLTSLYKKGKLNRVKYTKPGTRFFRYTVKEDHAS